MLCLILTFLMILPTFSLAILADGPVLITESSPDYKESIGFGGYIVRTKSDGSIMLSPFLNQLKTNFNIDLAEMLNSTLNSNQSLVDSIYINKIAKQNNNLHDKNSAAVRHTSFRFIFLLPFLIPSCFPKTGRDLPTV